MRTRKKILDKKDIIKKWEDEIKKNYSQLYPKVLEKRDLVKQKMEKITIWLGGPGKKNFFLYELRTVFKEILEKENFEVVFSEDFSGGLDLASKEIEEVEALNLILLLSITPGALAEAIEFAYLHHIRYKLWIYIPKEYKDGYAYRSLSERHRLLNEGSLFSLTKLKKYDPELIIKVLEKAINHRLDEYRRQKMIQSQ